MSAPKPKLTRSSENPDVDFSPFDPGDWAGSGHLPITSEIIGAIKHTISKQVSSKAASEKVANILVEHWTKRNVYTKDQNTQKCYQDPGDQVSGVSLDKENLPEGQAKSGQPRKVSEVQDRQRYSV